MTEGALPGNQAVRSTADDMARNLPVIGIPVVPDATTLWSRALVAVNVFAALFLFDRLTIVLMDLWLLQSIGQEEVFWTNFRAGAVLFVVGFAGVAIGIARPTFSRGLGAEWRRIVRLLALLAGMTGGYLLAGRYLDFLGFLSWQRFGQLDPVFGIDIGYFVFVLPVLWTIWAAVILPLTLGLAASVTCAFLTETDERSDPELGRLAIVLGRIATPGTLLSVGVLGVAMAVGIWLGRYDLLWKDNQTSAIYNGADYLDVVGPFSTLYYYYVTAFVVLGLSAVAIWALSRLRSAVRGATSAADAYAALGQAGVIALSLIALDFAFAGFVSVRDVLVVTPNEPVIQLPYIERHIQATREAYGLDEVETYTFEPNDMDDPIPDPQDLLASPTLRNVPLWPGWVSYLERVLDPQHADRVLMTGGDPMIYGPVMDILRQQQKLRMYYDFMSVDSVRYPIDGETRLFVSSAREIPLGSPQQWLQWWGQRFLLFTHGYGLVMAPVNEISGEGDPVYASFGIPAQSIHPELVPGSQALYYAEGATMMAYSNAQGIKEFDHASEEGRVEVEIAPLEHSGVVIDSALKRLVIGWRSGNVLDVWFSEMIGRQTRVHYQRTPLERAERIAPFFYFDGNPYAFATSKSITWMVNGIATTDRYPYSRIRQLGDKSDERALTDRPEPWINYVRDAVKVTIDAHSGAVTFYRISDDPVTDTWATVYPSLFRPGDEMPDEVRQHLQYPGHLVHLQFDDVYKRYHMKDALEFFNMEDLWDDGDEVLGPIIGQGKSITFSNEPHTWLAETTGKGPLPASDRPTQFVSSMYFTNEKAHNLRAMTLVYQDGKDYGRLVDIRVPKGVYYPSPEQADAAIDQEPDISRQISWWNRMGAQVIRGHTNALIIGNEVLYVEPIFLRSRQNTLSQLKRVVVVFRGYAADGVTLEEALTAAIEKARAAQQGVKTAGRPAPLSPATARADRKALGGRGLRR